jgi:hypothetical protein
MLPLQFLTILTLIQKSPRKVICTQKSTTSTDARIMISTNPVLKNALGSILDNLDSDSNVTEESDSQSEKLKDEFRAKPRDHKGNDEQENKKPSQPRYLATSLSSITSSDSGSR